MDSFCDVFGFMFFFLPVGFFFSFLYFSCPWLFRRPHTIFMQYPNVHGAPVVSAYSQLKLPRYSAITRHSSLRNPAESWPPQRTALDTKTSRTAQLAANAMCPKHFTHSSLFFAAGLRHIPARRCNAPTQGRHDVEIPCQK